VGQTIFIKIRSESGLVGQFSGGRWVKG